MTEGEGQLTEDKLAGMIADGYAPEERLVVGTRAQLSARRILESIPMGPLHQALEMEVDPYQDPDYWAVA